MANWKRIEKLRDRLQSTRQTKYRKFSMSDYIRILSGDYRGSVTVGNLRKNGPSCGSAACLAGEAVIAFAPAKTVLELECYYYYNLPGVDADQAAKLGQELLGLTAAEAYWMFSGHWSGSRLEDITKKQAIRYLNKVLKERDVTVRI